MKAIVRDAYGSVDGLRLAEIDPPVAGESEVLLRVHAAGVDQGVWHLMTGTPYVMRLAGFGLRAPKNPLLGYDVAGRVEAVGAQMTVFRPGDEVFGTCRGRSRSTRSLAQIASRRSPTTSASSRPRPSRSPGTPPCRRSATMEASVTARGC
jgi:NADPH:quinone reductase-like Zn-dependent oxidoreductase